MTRPALRPLIGRYPPPAPTVSGHPPPDTLANARNEIWCEAVYLGRRAEPAASQLFTSLLFGDKGAVPGLTSEQTALASRLELLARDVQREWLLRGISKEPPPKELASALPTPGNDGSSCQPWMAAPGECGGARRRHCSASRPQPRAIGGRKTA